MPVAVKPAMVYVESVSPSSSTSSLSARRQSLSISLGNSGWIGWWSPGLLVALGLNLLVFWEMMKLKLKLTSSQFTTGVKYQFHQDF